MVWIPFEMYWCECDYDNIWKVIPYVSEIHFSV